MIPFAPTSRLVAFLLLGVPLLVVVGPTHGFLVMLAFNTALVALAAADLSTSSRTQRF